MNLIQYRKSANFGVEFIYVLFLLSGYFKQYLQYLGFDKIDFTLFIGIILLANLCFSYLLNRSAQVLQIQKLTALTLMFAFILSVVVSLIYTKSSQFFLIKLMNFGVCILAYVFPLIIKVFDFQRFFRGFVNVSIMFAVIFLVLFPLTYKLPGLESIQATYLVVGYLCGLNLLLLSSVYKRGKVVSFLFLVTLFLSGARGALLFTSLAYLIMFFIPQKKTSFRIQPKSIALYILLFISFALFLSSSEFGQNMLERTVNRTMVLFGDGGSVGSSAQIRLDHINNSIEYISKNPFVGYGFGSYSVVTTGLDIRAYPHNSVLEVWFELGLFGLFGFLSIVLFHTVWNFWKISVGAGVIIMYLFLNSLVSSSFAELKLEFGLFAVFLLMSKVAPKSSLRGKPKAKEINQTVIESKG